MQRIDGTQIPTKTPASLLAFTPNPNHSDIENRNDRNAAKRINKSALVNMMFYLHDVFGTGRPAPAGRPDPHLITQADPPHLSGVRSASIKTVL
jgi:hypothetical protein